MKAVLYRTFSEVIDIPEDAYAEAATIAHSSSGDPDHLDADVVASWLDGNDDWPNLLDMCEAEIEVVKLD